MLNKWAAIIKIRKLVTSDDITLRRDVDRYGTEVQFAVCITIV